MLSATRKALTEQKLVAWNVKAAKYELTNWGSECREVSRA